MDVLVTDQVSCKGCSFYQDHLGEACLALQINRDCAAGDGYDGSAADELCVLCSNMRLTDSTLATESPAAQGYRLTAGDIVLLSELG